MKCKFCGGGMNYLQFVDGTRPPDYRVGGMCISSKDGRGRGCGAQLYGGDGNYRWYTHKEWETWVNEEVEV